MTERLRQRCRGAGAFAQHDAPGPQCVVGESAIVAEGGDLVEESLVEESLVEEVVEVVPYDLGTEERQRSASTQDCTEQ